MRNEEKSATASNSDRKINKTVWKNIKKFVYKNIETGKSNFI
jgi:hypothetical protein